MIIQKNKQQPEQKVNMRGGDGTVTMIPCISEADMGGKGRLFSRIILPPGASIGEHPHIGETETFYFISGKAEYTENDDRYILNAGDTAFLPEGQRHSVRNIGEEPLEMIALILYA